MAAVVVPAALFFALGGSAYPLAAKDAAHPVAASTAPCCMEVVTAAPDAFTSASSGAQLVASVAPTQLAAASRLRAVAVPRLLAVGLAPEQGLQVRTILASRAISAAFPEIHSIGGVRPDALRWHPEGLALDIMIPNPGSPQGIALGNEIVAYAMKNSIRFALQDAIWRGVYYTPNGPQNYGAGHFDHVHITTLGGGYPTGGELYYR
jgi:hypothetical protein